MVLGLLKRRKPDMLVVAMDSKEPTFRTKIYPEYKAHRPPMPDDMPQQIDRIEQILDAMNIPVLRLAGFEADDIIGTLAKKAGKKGVDVFICSKDKDILQLLDKHISAFDVKTDTAFGLSRMDKEMELTPAQFIDALALQGDKADNVPGIPDVGPKTALEWIQKYGSLENLYKHADEIGGKRGDNLRKHKEDAFFSRKLVTIDSDAPIDTNLSKYEVAEFNREKLTQLFSELGFTRLMTQLNLGPPQAAVKTKASAASIADGLSGSASSAKTVKHDYQLLDTPAKFEKFVKAISKQKLFALDTETTSVSPMRAELVGASFSWEKHKAFYLPIKAPMGQKHLDIALVRKKLAPILADEKVKKIGQNIKYDLHVLRNAKIPVRDVFFDTMVASYCLDASRRHHSLNSLALDLLNYECIPISALIGKGKNQLTFDMVDTAAATEYAAEDADITFQLYEVLNARLEKEPALKKLFEEVEVPLVTVLTSMECNGVCLDTKLLRKMSGEITTILEKTTSEIYEKAGITFNIDSPKQLAEVLFDRLKFEPIRVGKAGRSTDAGVLEELNEQCDSDGIIPLILQYRQLSKLKNTYVDKLGSLINPRTGKVHASFNQTITTTGRLSSSDPNLQNIPIRTELGRKIRGAFVPAEKNNCILSADYSQIELRFLAHFSRDKALLEAFANDQDIHRFVASQIFNIPLSKVTDEMRSRCKAVNFGIIYGQGPFGLSRTIGISHAEAKEFIDGYFSRYKSIRKFMDEVVATTKKLGYAETILHRRRKITGLASKNANKRAQAKRLAINTVIQGSAADLIKVAMINIQHKIEREKLPVKMILQIHDELVFELPKAEVKKHLKWISEEMTTAVKLDAPLKVDINHGSNWLGGK
jgi:DNA polymerase-1